VDSMIGGVLSGHSEVMQFSASSQSQRPPPLPSTSTHETCFHRVKSVTAPHAEPLQQLLLSILPRTEGPVPASLSLEGKIDYAAVANLPCGVDVAIDRAQTGGDLHRNRFEEPSGVLGADWLVNLRFASEIPGLPRLKLGGCRSPLLERLSVSEELCRDSALYLRSVCWITTALHGLRCHPLTCMSLKLCLSADSSPT
jgi:hypothetical protein